MICLSLLSLLSSSAIAGDRIPATLERGLDLASLTTGASWMKVAEVPLGKTTKALYCRPGAGCEVRGPRGKATPLAFSVNDRGIAFRRGEGVDGLKLGEQVIFLGTDKPQILAAFKALDALRL